MINPEATISNRIVARTVSRSSLSTFTSPDSFTVSRMIEKKEDGGMLLTLKNVILKKKETIFSQNNRIFRIIRETKPINEPIPRCSPIEFLSDEIRNFR